MLLSHVVTVFQRVQTQSSSNIVNILVECFHFSDNCVGLRAGSTVEINRFPVVVGAAQFPQGFRPIGWNAAAHKLQKFFEGGNEARPRELPVVFSD